MIPIRLIRISTLAVAVLGAMPVHAQQPAPAREPDLAAFDAYVAQAARDWNVPGMAVAIVHGDSIVFEKGYGTGTLGRNEPVDAHTRFAIASTTKAFTTAVMAMLVDEGKVAWDDSVTKFLPGFRVQDGYANRSLTIRDALTHRSGVQPDDLLWVLAYSRDDILRRMRLLPQSSPMRTEFEYNNLMYMVAGQVEGAAAGKPWDELVRTRILQPLGMRETTTGLEYRGQPNVASPHLRLRDTTRVITESDIDNAAPAGGMHSSVHDMALWLRFQLDSARVGGRRLITPGQYAEMFTAQVVTPTTFYPAVQAAGVRFFQYGLGWFLEDYRGHFAAMHTGSLDGMSAIVGMLPEERVAVVVLANLDHAELRHALLLRVFDMYLGAPPRDWSTELRTLYAASAARQQAAQRELERQRVRGTHPTLPLARYAGTYTHPRYGDLRVRVENGRLAASLGPVLTGTLEHWNYDTFRIRFNQPGDDITLVTFQLSPAGQVATASIAGIGTFARAPDAAVAR